MNETWENGKKNQLILGLVLAPFDPKLVLKKNFRGFYLF